MGTMASATRAGTTGGGRSPGGGWRPVPPRGWARGRGSGGGRGRRRRHRGGRGGRLADGRHVGGVAGGHVVPREPEQARSQHGDRHADGRRSATAHWRRKPTALLRRSERGRRAPVRPPARGSGQRRWAAMPGQGRRRGRPRCGGCRRPGPPCGPRPRSGGASVSLPLATASTSPSRISSAKKPSVASSPSAPAATAMGAESKKPHVRLTAPMPEGVGDGDALEAEVAEQGVGLGRQAGGEVAVEGGVADVVHHHHRDAGPDQVAEGTDVGEAEGVERRGDRRRRLEVDVLGGAALAGEVLGRRPHARRRPSPRRRRGRTPRRWRRRRRRSGRR